jgi:enoyl-CoA hydratase/carnithine racemase
MGAVRAGGPARPGWLGAALRDAGRPVPPLLERLGDSPSTASRRAACRSSTRWRVPRHRAARGRAAAADVKRRSKPLLKSGAASLWDIGDGVACLEFHSKMNALDPEILGLIGKAVAMGKKGAFRALVIHNEADNFSVGANIGLALFAANIGAWGEIEGMIEGGQKAMRAMRDAPFPVVGAPAGMALGGGCEILLHCDAVQAHAETYIGLVEVGVGLIPGWGGCAAMLRRWSEAPKAPRGPMPPVAKAFEMIATAQVAKSAFEAKEMMLLRPGDGITMNRDRLLADAKARALAMVEGYAPPKPASFRLPGATGRAALHLSVQGYARLGKATPHDIVVSRHLAETLTGGPRDHTEERRRRGAGAGAPVLHGAAPHRTHAGPHRAHARDGQAPPELEGPTDADLPRAAARHALRAQRTGRPRRAPRPAGLRGDARRPASTRAGRRRRSSARSAVPAQRPGDEEAAVGNGVVRTPQGFPQAYVAFSGGRLALAEPCDPDYGGRAAEDSSRFSSRR